MNMIRLVITIDPTKGLTIQGPVNDPIVCYGLLELAKDALRKMREEAANKIVPIQHALPPSIHLHD